MKNLSFDISIPLLITFIVFGKNLHAETYPYIGVSAGQATMEDVCESSSLAIASCEDTDISYKVYAGAKLHRNFAFELAYVDMGESELSESAETLTIEATGLNASLFGIIPASRSIDIFAKVGLMYWEAEKFSSDISKGTIASSKGASATAGLGVNFGISRHFALRAEYEKFLDVGGEQTTGELPVTLISVGLSFYF